MGRMIKALILAWLGKKIYDRVTRDDEPAPEVAERPKRGKKKAAARAA